MSKSNALYMDKLQESEALIDELIGILYDWEAYAGDNYSSQMLIVLAATRKAIAKYEGETP